MAAACWWCEVKQPIVYSAVGHDGILRMSLHPVLDSLDSRREGEGPRFPCRVVFSSVFADSRRWATSCRGKDSLSSWRGLERISPTGPLVWADPVSFAGEDVDGNAIAWLLAGEVSR